MIDLKFGGSILVLGDLMLDCYEEGKIERLSPEAPVPIISDISTRSVPGGAANVAMNLSALGINTTLVGVIGSDKSGDVLSKILTSNGIVLDTVESSGATTTKKRILSESHQLLRIDDDYNCTKSENNLVFELFLKHLKSVDLVLVSDYAKGAVSRPERIIKACKDAGVPIFIDPKNRDLSVYRGATLLKPNIHEFNNHYVNSDSVESTFLEAGEKLLINLELEKLLVTRGEKGMSLFTKGSETFSISEVSRSVYDVTGAGDTVFSVIGASYVSNKSDQDSIKIANEAACLAVENVGTKVISIEELSFRINRYNSKLESILYLSDELLDIINIEKKLGKKIVFTNGCFDILHSGHVTYLEEAASKGDILVVGLNSDRSVHCLKGEGRPYNSSHDRAKVLSALKSVDYVIEFDDDTPLNLIKTLIPDVLVKGGDYEIKDIVGADFVINNGGEVKVTGFVENQSSSEIINKVKEAKHND